LWSWCWRLRLFALDDDIFNLRILSKAKQNTEGAIECTIMMAKRELFEPSFVQPCKEEDLVPSIAGGDRCSLKSALRVPRAG
jgi:hypothetical protein